GATMDDKLTALSNQVSAQFGNDVTPSVALRELTVTTSLGCVHRLLQFLRDDPSCRFSVLIDICGADYPEREKRFDVIYRLLSLHKNHRIRVKVATDEQTPVPSAVNIWSAANWFEREAFDLYGIQ